MEKKERKCPKQKCVVNLSSRLVGPTDVGAERAARSAADGAPPGTLPRWFAFTTIDY